MEFYYSTVKDLKRHLGVSVNDLEFKTDEELDAYLEDTLIQAKHYIFNYINNEYEEGQEPYIFHHISLRIAANIINNPINSSQASVITQEDYKTMRADNDIVNDSIKSDLKRYKVENKIDEQKKVNIGFMRVGGRK